MALSTEGKDIVISGWENGVSDDPYSGLNNIRGLNIVSIPGEAAVSFAQTQMTNPPTVGTITSFSSSSITYTLSTGAQLYEYTCVQFTTTGTLPTGLSLATNYWVGFDTVSTFKVYTDCYLNTAVTITNATGSGTHTFTSTNMGRITYFEKNLGYCIDANGRAWSPLSNSNISTWGIGYTYMGNTTLTNANGNGLCVYTGSNGYKWLFIFRNDKIDYTRVADTLGIYTGGGVTEGGITPSWTYGWKTLNTASGANNPHEALVDVNNVMFLTDTQYLASLRETPGSTFDPTSAATYEWNATALALPKYDIAQCIEQLGDRLLIGGIYQNIYSWNKISTGFDFFQIAEKGTTRILTVSTNAFIFAGKRGRIFKSNGSQAELYKKIPDFLLGVDPLFTFYGVGYNKNQIYFGLSATANDGTSSTVYSGVWAIDAETGALRVPAILSTSTATCSSIFTLPSSTSGYSIYTAWFTASTYGIDYSTSSPLTTYATSIETERIAIGTFLNKATGVNVEFKLSAPLVSGEGIKISARNNLGSYAQIGETTTVGAISDFYLMNFDNSEWVQLKIELKSTATNPSFTRLKQVRLRQA